MCFCFLRFCVREALLHELVQQEHFAVDITDCKSEFNSCIFPSAGFEPAPDFSDFPGHQVKSQDFWNVKVPFSRLASLKLSLAFLCAIARAFSAMEAVENCPLKSLIHNHI